jgi:hypothetical protein
VAEVATLHHKVGTPGHNASDAPGGRFSAVFEDDGDTGYFYGLDMLREAQGVNPIVDALHIYDAAAVVDREAYYPIEIRWRRVPTASVCSSRIRAMPSSITTRAAPPAGQASHPVPASSPRLMSGTRL